MKKNINLKKFINDFYSKLNIEEIEFGIEQNIEIEKNISEMKFHKLFYFLYGEFWKENNIELFDANFEAWKYGPIEINYLNGNDIITNLLDKNEIINLEKILKKFLSYSTWYLTEKSQFSYPWESNFKKNKNNKNKNEEIKDFFVGK